MSFIYVITNDVNGKQYVGKTNHQTIEERFKEHIKDSKKERYEKRPLYDAMNKYGVEHFHIEELEECSCEEASNKEIYWIGRLDTYNNGYNATLGGDSKKYYDYKKIANKYLELKNQSDTAAYFGCDKYTVRIACRQYNIPIISSSQIMSNKYGKKVKSVDKQGNIREYNNMSDAGRAMIAEGKTHTEVKNISTAISKAIKRNGTLYGYKWYFI